MQKTSLEALGRQLRRAAGGSDSGRAADTVHGGQEKALRQTVVALVAGEDSWAGRQGDLIIVRPTRHRLEATSDATVLLTVVER